MKHIMWLLAFFLALPTAFAADPPPFSFGWTEGASVSVTEVVDKGEGVSTEQYTVTLVPREDGNLGVVYSDFSYIEFRGQKMTPEIEKEMAPMLALARAIPTVVISRTGQVVGIDGFEMMIEGLEKVMISKGATPEEARVASEMLRAPGVEGLLINTVKAIWSVWVADWIGLDLEPGKDSAGFVPVNEAAPDGPKKRVRVEHRGASEEHPGAVSLASAVVLDGDAAVAMLRPMFDGMLEAVQGEERAKVQELLIGLEGSIIREGTVHTDPATLRPMQATMTKTTKITLAALGLNQNKVETHSYTFDWSPGPTK
jgi:hypothetical protein